jgi:hypothetical protein
MSFPRAFLLTAIVYAIVGMTLGIYMGITGNFAPAPVHAHINLVGWVSLALFGLAHRAFPRLRAHGLATIQFWVAEAGALLLPVGIWLKLFHDSEPAVIIGSLLTLGAMLLFLLMALGGVRDD